MGPKKRVLLLIFSIAFAVSAAGCETTARIDRNATSSFTPYPDGSFRFRAEMSLAYPDNDLGEKARMTQLQSWLDSDGVCARGYEITSRRVVPTYGLVSDVNYQGRCVR
ncbi:hypothetical protein [Hansschlegelia zhihuaiae]|uniref:Lipoprotein n=1 Tax=Hansschlegelia zhihuaiae TaxID=405005 RepID=A0A4Q0MMI3_9HYPH|nr:hypothetical protein [Hansschlegelia zhihuaiae]RXF75037.1 hypothetical protein EK403_03025 [Hansschlegelia zhihuaiae]